MCGSFFWEGGCLFGFILEVGGRQKLFYNIHTKLNESLRIFVLVHIQRQQDEDKYKDK